MFKRVKAKSKSAATKSEKKRDLQGALTKTEKQLVLLRSRLAAHLIKLSSETQDPDPLIQADDTLRDVRQNYSFEDCPRNILLLQKSLGDALLGFGLDGSDVDILSRARHVYRTSISMASILGDDELRDELRASLKLTDGRLMLVSTMTQKKPSLTKAA